MLVFINNRNFLTWPKAMSQKLAAEGHQVTFVDNGSSYTPLLDWYSTCGFKVIRLANCGGQAPWTQGIVTELDEPYVVTDPDYDLSMIPSDWPEVLMEGFKYFPDQHKIGLSWDESQVPPENPAWIEDEMYKYPEGNPVAWANVQQPNNFFRYPCDTSFAVQKPHTPFSISGVRKGRPYAGCHAPWHLVLEESKTPGKRSIIFNDEHAFYFLTCQNSSFTWARLVRCGMIDEYLKRTDQTKESLIQKYATRLPE